MERVVETPEGAEDRSDLEIPTEFEIVFEPLPPRGKRGRKGGIWIERLTPLMDYPNDWARIATGPYRNMVRRAWLLNKRKLKMPEGRWEFASRKADEDRGYLYARYLGPDEPNTD
jgi:hypothetical protein